MTVSRYVLGLLIVCLGETFLGSWRVWSNYGWRTGMKLPMIKRVAFTQQYSKDDAPPGAKPGKDIFNDKPGANIWFTEKFLCVFLVPCPSSKLMGMIYIVALALRGIPRPCGIDAPTPAKYTASRPLFSPIELLDTLVHQRPTSPGAMSCAYPSLPTGSSPCGSVYSLNTVATRRLVCQRSHSLFTSNVKIVVVGLLRKTMKHWSTSFISCSMKEWPTLLWKLSILVCPSTSK